MTVCYSATNIQPFYGFIAQVAVNFYVRNLGSVAGFLLLVTYVPQNLI
jgi:hypothetical protein